MHRKAVEKAYEITDAKIQFVSLVDKAANLRTFLLTKQEDGMATFQTCGRIVKADAETHHVTGIVYEPMEEDAQGNYMTEEEITKACYWFTKNGNKVDLQHSFEPLQDAVIVENWVAKADFSIGDESIKKGTWLMTVELSDAEIWNSIQKGDITGFSMGGLGTYSEEDKELSKSSMKDDAREKRGLLKQVARALGVEVVEKGELAEIYTGHTKEEQFWTAFRTLSDLLCYYNPSTGKDVFERDEARIREALEEFSEIITEILLDKEPIAKALVEARPDEEPVEKAGRSLSAKNKSALQGIYESLGTFLAAFGDDDEDKEEQEDEQAGGGEAEAEEESAESGAGEGEAESGGESEAESESGEEPEEEEEEEETEKNVRKEDSDMTREEVEKITAEAIEKALSGINEEPQSGGPEEQLTKEQVQDMVEQAVSKAVEPILKARGVPSNLNGEIGTAKKKEQHYLHGFL